MSRSAVLTSRWLCGYIADRGGELFIVEGISVVG
jgi:hypothetical protein